MHLSSMENHGNYELITPLGQFFPAQLRLQFYVSHFVLTFSIFFFFYSLAELCLHLISNNCCWFDHAGQSVHTNHHPHCKCRNLCYQQMRHRLKQGSKFRSTPKMSRRSQTSWASEWRRGFRRLSPVRNNGYVLGKMAQVER